MKAFEFQDNPLSITDLAGRSARWIRPNFKALFMIFFWVQVLYHASWECFVWFIEKQGLHAFEVNSTRIILLVCLVTFVAIEYEIGARCVALWSLMTGKQRQISDALRQARNPKILLVFLPTIVNELSVALPMSFLLMLASEITRNGPRDHPVALDMTLLFGFLALMLWIIPFKCILLTNVFAAYTILVKEGSIAKGLAQIWFFLRKAPWTVLYGLILFGTLACLIELPAMITIALDEGIKQFSHLNKNVVEVLCLFLRLVVESTFSVISLGFAVAGAALFDNELRMRLEGQDIIDQLERIEKIEKPGGSL